VTDDGRKDMSGGEAEIPPALAVVTQHQPRARLALGAALAARPAHAYLFRGPRGSGKRAAARAFAAEILAAGAADPDDARRRAQLDPSPHPDLVWLLPRGSQHLVEEVREQVIRAAAYRPFEGTSRVFVIEQAEAMGEESQNALLKTLEEPPEFDHLLLLSAEPEALLETITSRCQEVSFAPLPPEAVADELAGEGSAEEVAAAARLAGGDIERARFLLTEAGRRLREEAETLARAAAKPDGGAPWGALLEGAESAGSEVERDTRARLEEAESGRRRSSREVGEEARRVGRRRRTEVLDLGLELCAAWLRDIGAVVAGAHDVVLNGDRIEELTREAAGLDPLAARRCVELVQDTRRRLDLNVSEELALEALFFRLQRTLGGGVAV
jgi:DNA polymerase-3 subunit delta'